jgi:hypothetical protein
VTRAQALAKDGLAAVRQSVKALREEGSVDGIAEQIASLVESVRDERFSLALTISGTPRPVSAAVALALHRTDARSAHQRPQARRRRQRRDRAGIPRRRPGAAPRP